MALNPQQLAFKDAYCNPTSATFGKVYKSARAVGINRMQRQNYTPGECLYFLYCPTTNRVKIGKTSGGVHDRTSQISSISSVGDKYEVLFSMENFEEGGEAEMHELFKDYREHGEWFRVDGDLKDFIDIMLAEPEEEQKERIVGISMVLHYKKHKEYVARNSQK